MCARAHEFEEGKEEIVVQTTALNEFNDDVIYTNTADSQDPTISDDEHEDNDTPLHSFHGSIDDATEKEVVFEFFPSGLR